MDNRSWKSRFANWFELGALVFGAFCGANMASGVYAAQYIVTKGGGWAIIWILMFAAAMCFFCAVSLNFIRCFKTTNFNNFYLALWGQQGPKANMIAKRGVGLFFDIYTVFNGIITTSATIALFSTLMNSLFDISVFAASVIGTVFFGVIVMFGGSFLRKFNSVITVLLLVSLITILVYTCSVRGDVVISRIGNFSVGTDWGEGSVSDHFFMFASYCMTTSSWGATLTNHAVNIHDKKDAIGTGIMCGVLGSLLFILTGAIVLPFMPEVIGDSAPILTICQTYFPVFVVGIYWFSAMLAVVSTAPNHPFNISNRFCGLWKSDKVPEFVKRLVIAVVFLVVCQMVSGVGLITIVREGYTLLGKVATFAIVLPLIVSIYRVYKKDKTDKAAES